MRDPRLDPQIDDVVKVRNDPYAKTVLGRTLRMVAFVEGSATEPEWITLDGWKDRVKETKR